MQRARKVRKKPVPETPGEKHPHIPARELIDRIVLGGSDGAIECLAMTSALNGAGVEFRTIAIAGLAFAVAGAFSMFFSTYLARKAELDSLRIDMDRERMEIETEPEEEKRELGGFLRKEGYEQREVDVIMNRLTRDKEMWLRAQLQHELHLHTDELESHSLARPAAAGLAFFLLALLAVAPYTASVARLSALAASAVLCLLALFALGSKVFTLRHLNVAGGLESAGVGAAAAALLYSVGLLISTV